MRFIAVIEEAPAIERILRRIGEPDCAPEIASARGPPDFCLELDQRQVWSDDAVDPVPEFEYDQTVNW